jgi:hypothetical protein
MPETFVARAERLENSCPPAKLLKSKLCQLVAESLKSIFRVFVCFVSEAS